VILFIGLNFFSIYLNVACQRRSPKSLHSRTYWYSHPWLRTCSCIAIV